MTSEYLPPFELDYVPPGLRIDLDYPLDYVLEPSLFTNYIAK